MIIKESAYSDFLKNITKYNAVLFHGNDRGKVTERSNNLLKELNVKKNNSIEIKELSPDDFSVSKNILHEIAYQKSFLSDLVIIKINLDIIKIDKHILDLFEILDEAKSNFFILESSYLRNSDTLVKLFTKKTNYAVSACYLDTKNNINTTIDKYLKKYSLNLDASCLHYLNDRLGNDTLITKNEIEKLALFAGNNQIKLENILNALGDNSAVTVFTLCDSLGISDLNKINYLYNKAKQSGASYMLILRSVLNHIIFLLSAKENKVININNIKPPIHFSRHQMVNQQITKLSLSRLKTYVTKLHKAEIACKLNNQVSDTLLKKLLSDLTLY